MEKSAHYLKIVEWSDEDECFVGRCPELMLGGVHGKNEKKVFAELCAVIEEWVKHEQSTNIRVSRQLAGKRYSGKFNLRLGKRLHERLVLQATKAGKSLNTYCADILETRLMG